MIVCLLMVMVRDDWLFVNGQTNNHLSPLPLTNKQSSLTITINKQTTISHHYHQQTNNHLSPLPPTNKQSSLAININKQMIVYLLMVMVKDDCLFVDGNGER
jgi:Fe-S-cluster containining protein